ncbi:DUF6377 domain-containing protein [Flammeovirga kamogawensis]|uniref:DUF6377 domain-containing protein n=2 Tax=Flammeovirga kamogawensis TaxID=373891 RepID=A0ABX8GQK6_9BACT|nr:DUF6377 domain-containing protein [Flammeovirga kamogawensis]QWG05699.1 hypothetical protein KM029_09915 [Flammeovirga kamogawensis]
MKMKIHCLIVLFLVCCSTVCTNVYAQDNYDFTELDIYLSQRETYFQKRLNQIDILKEQLQVEKKGAVKYELMLLLAKKYLPYNSDSALTYARSVHQLSKSLNDKNKLIASELLLSQTYILVGLYHEAIAILDNYRDEQLSPNFLSEYYAINAQLYNTLLSLRNTSGVSNQYKKEWRYYEEGILRVDKKGSLSYLLTNAELLKDKGAYKKAVEVLESLLSNLKEKDRVYAPTAYALADAYGRMGNEQKKINYLILSARSDIQNGIKEHAALRELALALFKINEIQRANTYLKVALEDAVESNTQLRQYEVLEILPVIDHAYQENQTRTRTNMKIFITVVSLLSVVLFFAIFFIQKQKGKLQSSNKQVVDANTKLHLLNEQLKESNDKVASANLALKSVNNIQEESIARYLKLCSMYIGKMDDYRKQLLRKGNKGTKEDILKLLKSKEVVDQELKLFYKDFDESFLKLYPNFVADYNHLMQPEAKIILKKSELLNTELRVFALVRLGIDESTQIAEFLRYSITTIYNYRTKARNNTIVEREQFEDKLKEI